MEKIIGTVPGKCRKKREKARLTLNNNPEISWHMKKSRRTYNGVHLNKKSNTQDVVEQSLTVLQSCADGGTDRDRLCGSWTSVDGKPDVLVYKEGEAYKVTVFARSGKTRRLRPQTYLLVEENGNLFINTGYRIDVSYNEETDILTFSPNGDYVRKEERP